MNLTIGILIIGSLYWDPARQAWRDSRLRMNQAYTVKAPIRYGRLSQSRGNTYTMVFSRECELGQAKVVPCRSTAQDLVNEAEHLWAAERNAMPNRRISGEWGCVALLIRSADRTPQSILHAWATRVSQEPRHRNVPQTDSEGSLVDNTGLLQIGWPTLIHTNKPAPLDLLLATVTHPTLVGKPRQYPDTGRIADAWRRDTQGNISYFRNNQANGVLTFEDDAISKLL